MEAFDSCVSKFAELKSMSKLAYTVEEFTLFAWILLSDKFFGFTIEITNFYKQKISYIQRTKGGKEYQGGLNTRLDKGTSIVELPRVFHPAEKEYLTFGQMMWILTKGNSAIKKWDRRLNEESFLSVDLGFLIKQLSKKYSRMNLLRNCRLSLIQYFKYMQEFYGSIFEQPKIKEFWNSHSAKYFIDPFLFEHAKINELQHDADGVVNAIKTRFIIKFNYDKFHRTFTVSHERMIDALMPLLFTKKFSSLIVSYLNSFVNVLKLLTLPHDVIRKDKENKRINDVDQVMDRVDSTLAKDAAEIAEDNPRDPVSGLPAQRSGQDADNGEYRAEAKLSDFDKLFERNFKEVRRLVNNEFHGEPVEVVAQFNTNMDRIRAGRVVSSSKQDMIFSFDKMTKKKKPIMVKTQVTENLEEAVRYNTQLLTFQENLFDLDFDFSIDLAIVFSQIQDKEFDGFSRNKDEYDLLIKIDNKQRVFHKSDAFAERTYFWMKIKFNYEAIPFEHYENFVKIASVDIKFYYPLLQSHACLRLEEPCFIIKFLRILSLCSEHLRNTELYALFGHLLAHHHPKNTFANVDVAVNAAYLKDDKHFYMTVLRVCDPRSLTQPISKAASRHSQTNIAPLRQVSLLSRRQSRNSLTPTASPRNIYSPSSKYNSQLSIVIEFNGEKDNRLMERSSDLQHQESSISNQKNVISIFGGGYSNKQNYKGSMRSKSKLPAINLYPVSSEALNMRGNPRSEDEDDPIQIKDLSVASPSPVSPRLNKMNTEKGQFGKMAEDLIEKPTPKKQFNWKPDMRQMPSNILTRLTEPKNESEYDPKNPNNYDPDGFAYLRANMSVNSERDAKRKFEKFNKYLDADDENTNTVRRLDQNFEVLPSSAVNRLIDEELKIARISFKFHNLIEEDGDRVKVYRFTENTEGFLNTTLQKNINSNKPYVQEISELPQEKVKERLIINDTASKNSLEGVHGCRKDIFSFIQKIEGLGKCHLKICSFYSKADYTSKTVIRDAKPREGSMDQAETSEMINMETFYEDFCHRLVTVAKNIGDSELDDFNSSLNEFPEIVPVLQILPAEDMSGRASPKFGPLQKNSPMEFQFGLTRVEEGNSPAGHSDKTPNIFKGITGKTLNRLPSFNLGRKLGSGSAVGDSIFRAKHKIFKKEEILLLNIQLVPMNYKYRESKVILNSQDINSLLDISAFFSFCMKTTDPSDIEFRLKVSNPKLIFTCLLRYLVSKIEMAKTAFYRQPCFRQVKHSKCSLVNIFNKYEHNTNIVLTNFLDKVSANKVVLFSGIRRSNNYYFIVTVVLNRALNSVLFKVYNPRATRTFLFDIPAERLVPFTEQYMFKYLFPLFLNESLQDALGSYNNFASMGNLNFSPRHRGSVQLASKPVELDELEEEDDDVDRTLNRGETGMSPRLIDLIKRDMLDVSESSEELGRFALEVNKAKKVIRKRQSAMRKKTKLKLEIDTMSELTFEEKFSRLLEIVYDPLLIKLFAQWDKSMTNGNLCSLRNPYESD